MIKIYQSTGSGLEVVDRPAKGCWIDLIDPSVEDARRAVEGLGVPAEAARAFVKTALAPDSVPRAEKAGGALFIVARVPHFQGEGARIPYLTVPLGIILTDEFTVTICKQDHGVLHNLDEERKSAFSTHKPHIFVLHFLWGIATRYLAHLSKINEAIDRLEDRLQRALENREVLELLRYQKCLILFTTGLETNELMLERLQRAKLLELKAADEDVLDDLVTENHEAMLMAEIASDMLSNTMDAFASIISNNLNVVMKFLASVTIVLIIPQIVGTFYGMNVSLPIEDHPLAFGIMVGLSFVLSAVVAFIFWKKKWL
jgi:magnesium transporter